ncbi:hypothetical protein GGR56DRAFT_350588 [Xylariaceae sp. FL0804]|nr:hypothetical protein GGR56DRAFT_350588 [Xylariaceae sp. FL0804]
MLFQFASGVAIGALVAPAVVAEPLRQPYQPQLFKMSARQIFGLEGRSSSSLSEAGYSPATELCSTGSTCAEACGTGYAECTSDDGVTHCYNKAQKQTCCAGSTGESCDEGYFCSADNTGAAYCCPDSMTLGQCAEKYGLPDTLTTSQQSSKTSATSTTTDSSPTVTSESTSTSTTETTTAANTAATTTSSSSSSSSTSDSDISTTTDSASSTSATSSSAMVEKGAGGHHGPSSSLLLGLLVPGFLAALV